MIKCDICEKKVNSKSDLVVLEDRLQTKDIKDICKECDSIISSKYLDLRLFGISIGDNLFVKYIKELKDKFSD